jgi:hypothetical protein
MRRELLHQGHTGGYAKDILLGVGASLCVGIALSAVQDRPYSPKIKQPLAGTWTLVSIYEEDAGGEEVNRFEGDAKGQLIADENGNFSLQIMNLGARRYSATPAPCVDSSGLIDAMAYFGTYFLDSTGERLTLRVERCLFKECDLIDQVITSRINGNVMEWISFDAFSTTGAYYRQFVWQRK